MIHPTALIDPRAEIDPTAQVGAYVIIEGPVKLGRGVVVQAHAQILSDVTVGAGTVIGRAAIIGGDPQDLSFDPATESGVVMGERNVIREHVTIHRGSKPGNMTRLGDDNFIMATAHLAHDVSLGNKNVLANAALLAGHVQIGNNSFVGGGAVFHQYVRVGDYCIIQGNGGLGKDLPHYCCAQRINRMTGLNVIGLRRAGFSREDRAAIKEVFDTAFRKGLNFAQALKALDERQWPEACQKFIDFLKAPSKRSICRVRARGAGGRDDDELA
jgi:UDP-N-acetylglucosamine acyltransferase